MTMCYVVKSYNKKTSADTLKSTETSQSNVTTSGQSVEGSVTLKMGAKATSRISFFAALLANCSQLAQSVHEEVPRIETQAVFFSIRAITCMAKSEWPPRSKKLSWTPTCSTSSNSCQISARDFSRRVWGLA